MAKEPHIKEDLLDEIAHQKLPQTRTQFKRLVLSNPNYFGNMPDLGFKAVEAMTGNTTFEELVCLGLNPQQKRLEAVVHIKRHSGYETDSCGVGSPEFVRFYVERAGVWHDLGAASFTSYNMPGSPLPLSYSVSVEMNEARKYCSHENLMRVRGILSWHQEPPAGSPDWPPPWGNVLEATVQIEPWTLPLISLEQLLADQQITIKPELLKQIDLQQALQPIPAPQPLSYAQLKEAYAKRDVPGHRFGFAEAHRIAKGPITSDMLAFQPKISAKNAETVSVAPSSLLLNPELAGILNAIDLTVGDTTYEELVCVGYNPATRIMAGVVSVKKSYGYSGGLCSPGSTEYVNFWGQWGGSWHSLGGAQVKAHDLAGAGGKTVEYAVFRAVNLPEHVCENLAGIRVRAILSWQVPPTGPDFDPTWGNVVDTYVQPTISSIPVDVDNNLRLMRINRVTVNGIDDSTGRADNSGAIFVSGDCKGNDSPFGGSIFIEGDFVNKANVFHPTTGDVLPGAHPLRYQVFISKGSSSVKTQLVNSFTIAVFPEASYLPVVKTQSIQTIGGDQFYIYMEGDAQAVNPRTLAVWQASGLEEGEYTLEIRGFAWDGSAYAQAGSQSKLVYVYNGYPHTELLSNGSTITTQRPEVHMQITSPGGDCGDFVVGDTITGTYSVRDQFFGELRIRVLPITVGGVPQPVNAIGITDSGIAQPNPVKFEQTAQADTLGMSGTWSLDTTGMTPCGYTIQFWSWDRALVSNSCVGHYNETGVGFCLRAAD